MAATKLQANWTAVTHGATQITRVDSVSFDQGGSLVPYSGDADIYPVVIANLLNNPSASVTSSDPAALMGISIGTTGSFSATHKDAKAAASGAISYVLANAVVQNVQTSGAHAAYGNATMTMLAYSADGTTNPLSFTRT